uniref:Exocyst subunit Exo70 family protein n=1 Tax=Triticum urartu TaxID=4572 RepID=A0A8R7RAG7_TRIUA
MGSEGYTQRMVQAFDSVSLTESFGLDPALRNWFVELDVDWVLKPLQFQLQSGSGYWLQEVVERWIRALIIIVASIDEELVTAGSGAPAAAQFVTTSVSTMLIFVDAIVQVHRKENLQVVLDMFICVCHASHMISSEAPSIFNEIGATLEREGNKLWEIILNMMKEVRTLAEEDDSWAIEIPRGGGEVHRNTRFIMDCVVSMMNARTSMKHSAPTDNTENLGGLIDGTIDYLKGLLFTKSESCSDQSLRYLFLLNNSYFVADVVFESSRSFIPDLWHLTLPPECKKYMDSYLDVSWGHVLSCIPKSRFPRLIRCWINTSSLAKFESAFHKMYQAQKFWKVPDPQLRGVLRKTITKRVISGYGDYLEEHPELEKYVGRQRSSLEVLKEMLGELFEG